MNMNDNEFDAAFEKYPRRKKVDLTYEKYDPQKEKSKSNEKIKRRQPEERVARRPRPEGDVKQTQRPRPEGNVRQTQRPRPEGDVRQTQRPRPEGDVRQTQRPRPEGTARQAQRPRPQRQEPKEKAGFFGAIGNFFAHAGIGEYSVIVFAIILLVFGGYTYNQYHQSQKTSEGVESLIPIGEQLGEVANHPDVLINTIISSYVNGQEANKVLESLDESIEITATFSSIMQDLKVKFVNKKTDELVTGIPFKIEIIPPQGESLTEIDEDKDGVIYVTGLTGGDYQVVCKSVGNVSFSADPIDVVVKAELDYSKINIINEVKEESEVVVSQEDTEVDEVEVESVLKDTVAWVASTKTVVGDGSGYTELDKTKITDPLAIAFLSTSFFKVSGVNYDSYVSISPSGTVARGTPLTASFDATTAGIPGGDSLNYSWTVNGVDQATDQNILDILAEDYPATGSTMTVVLTVTDNTDPTKSGTATKTVNINSVSSVTLSPTGTKEVMKGTSFSVTSTTTMAAGTSTGVTWSSNDAAGAAISYVPNGNGTATVTIAATATAGQTETLTATSKDDPTKAATLTIKVVDSTDITVTLDKEDEAINRKKTLQLKATVTRQVSSSAVTWSSSDTTIATVDANGLVTAVGIGEATITVTTVEAKASDATKKATDTCKVTVNPLSIKITSSTDPALTSEEIYVGETVDLTAVFESYLATDQFIWVVTDDTLGKVTLKSATDGKQIYTFEATKVGTVGVTVKSTAALGADGKAAEKSYYFKVVTSPKDDTVTKLTDNDGTQVYVKDGTTYREATYSDYYKATTFYVKGEIEYTYTGWQTLSDGRTYYFDKNGKKVTGYQVIQGVEYEFSSLGVLSMGDGTIGIDVSKWNGTIDWKAVKESGVDFAIIRCGYRGSTTGALIIDSKFEENMKGAIAAGIKVGVYFFTQAITESEAIEEASMVLALTSKYTLSYPIFIDTEGSGGRADSLDKSTRTAVVNAFCKTIRKENKPVGIYAAKNWFNTKLSADQLSSYTIWVAQYATANTYTGKYDMWQYTSTGHVGGISGNVDMNKSYVNY